MRLSAFVKASLRPQEVNKVLGSLVIKPGGKGIGRQKLSNGWTIILYESFPKDPSMFTMEIEGGGKKLKLGLKEEHVFTKGKGRWRRDNLWRIKPEAVAKLSKGIVSYIENIEKAGG